MKAILLLLFLLINLMSFGQITEEKQYNNGSVTRIKMEYSGEKYYEFVRQTNKVLFYNSDHTLWKSITLPADLPNALSPSAKIIHVSESKINPDTNLEIVFSYYNFSTGKMDCKVYSENGTTLLTIPNASYASYMSEIPGLADKLIAIGITETSVYSIPSLVLENTYNADNLVRMKLESSGEKYYLLDKLNQNSKIFNPNHSLWKTVSLPKPTNSNYTSIDFVSETKINANDLVEIGYSFSETLQNNISYTSKIVTENNEELLVVPNSSRLEISGSDGQTNKLFANLFINFVHSTNVYTLPSLSLETTYNSKVVRANLETAGEKYVAYNTTNNQQIKIYNANHTIWKTIDVQNSLNPFHLISSISHISESKINNDSSIEIVYTYLTGLLALGSEYSSRVINENGTVLLEAHSGRDLRLDEIEGLNNKLIVSSIYPYRSVVYSIGTLGILNFDKNPKVIISPNPVSSFLNIHSSVPIKAASIYDINGKLLMKVTESNIVKINLEPLLAGIYILHLTDLNNQKTSQKITVAH